MSQEQFLKVIARLEAAAVAMETTVLAGANAYANGEAGGRPIVAKHFTAGNQERYGWAPLSRQYAQAKAAGIISVGGGGKLSVSPEARRHIEGLIAARDTEVKAALKGVSKDKKFLRAKRTERIHAKHERMIAAAIKWHTQGRLGSKLDKRVGSGRRDPLLFGASAGQFVGTNLPMLVRTGHLRDCVTTIKHAIKREGDTAYISFDGLPEYAHYLEEGTAKMPRRSPVEPGPLDREAVQAAMQRHLDAALGTGRANLPQQGGDPGVARMAAG